MEEGQARAQELSGSKSATRFAAIKVRLSAEEYEQAETFAKEHGLPLSTYARQVLLRRRLTPAVPAANFDTIDQLRRLGNNVNQALVAVYTRGVPSSFRPLLLELITLIRKLRAELAGKVAEDYERTPIVQPANDADLEPDPAEDTPALEEAL